VLHEFETEFGAEPGGVGWPSAALCGEGGLVLELAQQPLQPEPVSLAAFGRVPRGAEAQHCHGLAKQVFRPLPSRHLAPDPTQSPATARNATLRSPQAAEHDVLFLVVRASHVRGSVVVEVQHDRFVGPVMGWLAPPGKLAV
jgi:hypothetical protein